MTPCLTVSDAGPSCRLLTNELWTQLVQLHPQWKESFSHESHALWNAFSCDLVACANDLRSFDRFEILQTARASLGPTAWTWDFSATRAKTLISMQYLWSQDVRPLNTWVVNWFLAYPYSPSQDADVQLAHWDNWMADTVLPTMTTYPDYENIYRYVAKEKRLSINTARVPRLERLRPYLPMIHLAAAWHNDPCWLSVRLHDDEAWCNYAALHRLFHPRSFYKFAPDLKNADLKAPLQHIWNMAYSLHWTWPMLLDQLLHLSQTRECLALPDNFAKN